ncbi:ATP synthase F1 subunit gamma [bacterium]|nr:ATP synthase F1 subunit gamma [bacterium]
MAKQRDVKRRIKSVKNTAKITHTMELVATAKAKLCTNRIQRAIPYFQALAEIAGEARKGGDGAPAASGPSPDEETAALHPLLEERPVKKVTIFAVAANRGLCGGYNGNVLRMAKRRREELQGEGREVTLVAVGRKLANGFKYQQIPFEGVKSPMPDDRPPYAECEKLADDLARRFMDGTADRVEVLYTHYFSAGRQAPVIETLLPIVSKDEEKEETEQKELGTAAKVEPRAPKAGKRVQFLIEPDPRTILDAIFPLQAKLHVYRVFLEAAASEQIARRVAMKNASDNAEEVGKALRMQYNRVRQASITKEILEIVGGSEALA